MFVNQEDTIAAIASAPGIGAIAIVRVSGPQAFTVADAAFSRPLSTLPYRTSHYGAVLDVDGEPIDWVLAVAYQGPASFTGEDVVEFQCHGGAVLPHAVLQRLLGLGARMALPGEFSSRAVWHGKLDLVQAEAIQALIGSRNARAARVARRQLEGGLSRYLRERLLRLTDLAAILEAWVDFPQEDLEFASFDEVAQALSEEVTALETLYATYDRGRTLDHGVVIALAGLPNAGKSSLMNVLLGKERAIVTAQPGTTRDVLEGSLTLGGAQVQLLDTAGLRSTEELIEAEGIRRATQAIQHADLRLLVLDATRAADPEQAALIEQWQGEDALAVWNKVDLCPDFIEPSTSLQTVCLSARTGRGVPALVAELARRIEAQVEPAQEALILTEARHAQALQEASASLHTVIEGLQQRVSAEYVAFAMRNTLHTLGGLLGDQVQEALLGAIFSRFCLGK